MSDINDVIEERKRLMKEIKKSGLIIVGSLVLFAVTGWKLLFIATGWWSYELLDKGLDLRNLNNENKEKLEAENE